jgi:hypothetical protein
MSQDLSRFAGWPGGALVGVFHVLAHFLKSSTAAVSLFFVILYSCLFGMLGWLVYTLKGRRDGWPSVSARDRRRAKLPSATKKHSENAADDESGWHRS